MSTNNLPDVELNKYERGLHTNILNIYPQCDKLIDSMPKSIWVFHHTDMDGYCSGHIVERWLHETGIKESESVNEIHLIAADYNTDFSKFEILPNDVVIFVDLSFTIKTVDRLKSIVRNITKNIIWIDHHASNVDLVDNDEEFAEMVKEFPICVLGNKENKYSAAMLTYCTLFRAIPMDAPYYIKLVSDWDTWTHNLEDSIYFNEAMNGDLYFRLVDEEGNINKECTYIKLWEEAKNNDYELVETLINKGKPVVDDRRVKDSRYLRSNGFEFELFGYKWLVCNQRSNSLLFGDKINEYDIVCPFVLQQRNGKLIYTYSLFTANKEIDCKEIAELFGGGGHQGAAGFSLKWNLFTCNKLLLRFRLFKLKCKSK